MKKCLLLLVSIFFLYGCPPDDDDPGIDRFIPGALTAKIDGVLNDFESDQIASNGQSTLPDNQTFDSFFISAQNGEFSAEISIDLVPFNGTGTYPLSSPTEGDTFSYARLDTFPPGGGLVTSYGTSEENTGVVNITFYDGVNIRGTFSFIAGNFDSGDTVNITEGTIDLQVQN